MVDRPVWYRQGVTAPASVTAGRSPAWARIVATATRLFYAEGVHAVGVDRIIAEAGVAKATFYHHFPGKDDLVRACVHQQSLDQRALAERATASATAAPRETLRTVFELMCEAGTRPAYRGCPFINIAAEYPDPAHPVRRSIDEHRRWMRGLFHDLLTAAGHPEPDRTADVLVLLKDGLWIGFDLDDPGAVRAAAHEAVARVLDAAGPPPPR